MVSGALGIIAYVTGNVNFASYLQIPYVPGVGELVVLCGALVGAGLGFLWFNTYPAQVFMGDVGALGLGDRRCLGRRLVRSCRVGLGRGVLHAGAAAATSSTAGRSATPSFGALVCHDSSCNLRAGCC